jgi:hypothetical protein
LHGTWDSGADAPYFILTANEMTLVVPQNDPISSLQFAFRTEFSGNADEINDTGGEFTLSLTRIFDGVDFGSFTATFDGDDDIVISSANLENFGSDVPWYENAELLIPATYVRNTL